MRKHKVEDPATGVEEVVLDDGHSRVTRTVTHELGHVFGLANYSSRHCKAAPHDALDPNNYTQLRTVMGPALSPSGGSVKCYSSEPTDKDVEDYQLSYVPEAPTILTSPALSGSPRANEVRISWDALIVHVEKEFAIQRKTGPTTWATVKTHEALPLRTAPVLFVPFPMPLTGPQIADVTLTGQTPGWQTYRVVSVTSAPQQTGLAASAEITIDVLAPTPPFVVCPAPGLDTIPCVLSPPSNLTVSDVSNTGAMLHWGDVAGAAGYKVRRDGIANRTQTLGDVNSHPFTRLTARTAHVLEVATTISSGDSRFASLTLLLPPTLHTPTKTSSTITLTWAGDTNAISHEVKLGATGTEGPADTNTSHTFRSLRSDTPYALYVRALNTQGPSAWVWTAARTSSPSSPGPGIDVPTPCEGKTRPADFTTPRLSATDTETRWALVFVTPSFCLEYEETRTVTITVYASVTYSCDGECWVAAAEVIETTTSSAWSRTGSSRICNFPRSATPGQYSLSAGHYELEWAEERIAFTVPAGSSVELAWRQQESGDYVAVLSMKKGAELVVGADALSGDDQARATRFAGTTDPTLSAIAASLRDPATEAPEPSVTTTTECAVAEPSEDGVANVDLDAEFCVIVRGGGAVTVAQDEESLAITLAAGRDWLVVDGTGSDDAGTTAATFVDLLTGGSITLALTDGSELARHIPEGNTELPALFDAMIPAAPAGDGS